MTATVTLSCDRMRNGQPCRGALHTRARHAGVGRVEAIRDHGWTSRVVDLPDGAVAYVDTCPSAGHDEP